jgi:Na+-transporting NADH:ubiquinone oxidoreductase subunit NqrF
LIRSYTPIIPEVGFLTFAIKHYPDAPKGAKKLMSAYLYNLKQGSDATASGPYAGPPQLNCLVPQTVSRRLFLNETPLPQFVGKGWFPERVGMICVGTGISPMLQIIDFVFSASLSPDSCHSQLSLVFGNRSESDILFSAQLEACRQSNPDRFRAHFFLSQMHGDLHAPKHAGRIDLAALSNVFADFPRGRIQPAHAEGFSFRSVFFICGPIEFSHHVRQNLLSLDFVTDQIVSFSIAGDVCT